MKRTSESLSLLFLAVILSVGVGCAKKPDDAKMSADIQAKFSQDSGLASKQLSVQASKGVVTLAGAVDNEAQRDAASRQAASEPGVTQVINNLEIGNATPVSAMTPADQAPVSEVKPAHSAPMANSKPTPGKKSRKSHRAGSEATADAAPPASNETMAKNDPAPPPSTTPVAAPATPDIPPPPKPKKMIVDQGTQLTVRLVDAIDSEKNHTGDTFHATLNTPLSSDGEEVVPAGSDITGHLVDVKSAGKFKGQSEVVLQLDSITVGGKTYNIQTDQYKKDASSRGKNTAEKVGGGAAIGAIIGAIAGGGKGAAIGGAAGAGVGGGVQAATKGQQIKLPSETVLNFTLQAPITVIQAPSPNADRPKLGDAH
jgi:hypothetical protein